MPTKVVGVLDLSSDGGYELLGDLWRHRPCPDAIQAIFQVGKGANPARRWVLDADPAAAFDRPR
jgi:hypothetical protein